MRDLIE